MEGVYARKLSFVINTIVLMCVLGLWAFFQIEQAKIMVIFSIPTVAIYLINYVLIYKEHYDEFIWLTYFWILIYMGLATVCLGINYGFHLYCMSLIPVIYCTEYMAYKLSAHSVRSLHISIVIAISYMIITGYVVRFGAIYEHPVNWMTNVFLAVNVIIVFGFLISYSNLLVKMVLESERKLLDMAHKDKLTKLFNRHYAMEELDHIYEGANPKAWVAMIDIDNFKKFNDQYGHDCGDYVLIRLSELMQEVCEGCLVSRWGGEEFLIASSDESSDIEKLEELRKRVENEQFEYGEQKLSVTITIGATWYKQSRSLDKWIQRADEKLYDGKESGKNKVVI